MGEEWNLMRPSPGQFGLATLRGLWGMSLLIAPGPLLRRVGDSPTPAGMLVLRVLGLRHATQAVIALTTGSPVVGRLGAAADALHATTDLVAAAKSPRWRRAALLDSTVAAGFAAAGVAIYPGRRTSRT